MKKMKYLLFINVISLILLVTVSFAWIVEINSQEGRIFAMNFGQMYIAPTEIGVELFVVNKDGTTTNKTQLNGTSAVYTATNVQPGEYTLYILKLTNQSPITMNVGINFTNITKDEAFYDYINIGVSHVSGFDTEQPDIEDFFLSNRLHNGAATLLDSVLLPPKEGNTTKTVEIKFYIRLSHETPNELQNKELFQLGTINIISS